MRVIDKRPKVSRRGFLGAGGASLIALSVLPGGMIVAADQSWAVMSGTLKPETFATLVQMSRDIYPHDRLNDGYYAKAVQVFDEAAAKSDDSKAMFEEGVTGLNAAADAAQGVPYAKVGWEEERVAILRDMEKSPFFQAVRGGLITGIYNNPDVWPLFGYEGESASKGGYINRGFDDIDWLDQV